MSSGGGGSGGGGAESGELPDTKPAAASEATNNNNNNNNNSNNSNKNRYWMKDVYKYSYPRGYGGASGLYNLAWAQAVQNKPLNDVLVELDNSKDDKNDSEMKVDDKDDSEKEEGELEEGEIDGEFEDGEDSKDDKSKSGGKKEEVEDGELEMQVSSIRKVLDNVTAAEANKHVLPLVLVLITPFLLTPSVPDSGKLAIRQ